jgi:3-oxoacyl-[acyl-carrier protein] reductase
MVVSGKVALITGAAGAIGSTTARRLGQSGYALVLADASDPESWKDSPPDSLLLKMDVRCADQVRAAVDRALSVHGRIDVLVNVAGVTSFGSAQQLPEAEWQRVLDINLSGSFRCCQAVIPSMIAQGHGRIVNLGSVLGKNGGNARPWIDRTEQQKSGNVAYGVSKAGVHAMTIYLARELADLGITVNAVAPGPIASDMTTALPASIKAMIPVGRMGTPEDVASTIAFLVSDAAAFITGEVIDINGGMWCD